MDWRSRKYEVLPVLSIRGPDLRKSLRTVTTAWMFGVVWLSCISGGHVKIFARMLGFNDLAFGLMSAIPFLATFGQLVAAVVIERTGMRKHLFLDFGTVHRLLWLAIACIPLVLPAPSAWAVAAMLTALALSSFLAAVSAPAWLTWMASIIPRRIRGRYFASRERLALSVQAVVVLTVGVIFDSVYRKGVPEVAAAQPVLLWTVCAVFAVAAVFGAIDILLFHRIREVLPTTPQPRGPQAPPPAKPLAGGETDMAGMGLAATVHYLLVDPLKDRVFRSYVLFGATITFSATVSGWFFWLTAMETLGFTSLAANAVFLVIGPMAGILSARGWGKAVDHWGRRPVLILGTLGATLAFVPWFLATPDMAGPGFVADGVNAAWRAVAPLLGRQAGTLLAPGAPVGAYLLTALACMLGGASWTGIGLAQIGVVFGFSEGSGRSRFVAASSVLISMGGVLGGVAGGTLTQALHFLQAHPVQWGALAWNNWHAALAVGMVTRLLSIFWLVGMPDPGAARVRSVVRYVSMNVYNNVLTSLFYPLRVFGWRPGRSRKNGLGPETER